MEVTITLGWWCAPAVVTAVAFLVARLLTPPAKPTVANWYELPDLLPLFTYSVAFTASSISWFIWAVLTLSDPSSTTSWTLSASCFWALRPCAPLRPLPAWWRSF